MGGFGDPGVLLVGFAEGRRPLIGFPPRELAARLDGWPVQTRHLEVAVLQKSLEQAKLSPKIPVP